MFPIYYEFCDVKREILCCSLGFGLSAIFFFGLALVVDGIHAVIFLTIAVGLSGIAISGASFTCLTVFLALFRISALSLYCCCIQQFYKPFKVQLRQMVRPTFPNV